MGEGFSGRASEFEGRVEATSQQRKLEAAKESLLRETQGFSPEASVAIFAFNDSVELIFEGKAGERSRMEESLRSVQPSGNTNIALALRAAIEYTRRYERVDCLLISDGLSNRDNPVAAARECNSHGVIINVVLIDPTPEGDQTARSIAEPGGRVYAVRSAADFEQGIADAGVRQQLRHERSERLHFQHEMQSAFSRVQELVGETRERLGVSLQLAEDVRRLYHNHEEVAGSLHQASSEVVTLKDELHSLLTAHALGIPVDQAPIYRVIPVRVYLRTGEAVQPVVDSANTVLKTLAFQVAHEYPAQHGSFWQRWCARSTEALSHPEVQERLQKLEKAAEVWSLGRPQAEIDKNLAEAVSKLIEALRHEKEAAAQVGSILLLKLKGPDGQSRLTVQTLSVRQLIALEKDPDILKEPGRILKRLAIESGRAKNRRLEDSNNE
jgi:hypothetical protein